MKQLKQLSRATLALLAAFIMVGAVPAFAQHGLDDGPTDTSGSSSTGTPTTPEVAQQKAQAARETAREAQKQAVEAKGKAKQAKTEAHEATETAKETHSESPELHQKGDDLVEKLRKERGIKAKTPEERQKQCEAHQARATANFSKMSTGAGTVLTRIDGIYAKALDYQTTNNLSPDGIDTLIATANSNKAAAASSVSTLRSTIPTIDCTSPNVASQMATYKLAAQDARDKLKAYRTSVRAVLQALQVPKPTTTNAAGGTN